MEEKKLLSLGYIIIFSIAIIIITGYFVFLAPNLNQPEYLTINDDPNVDSRIVKEYMMSKDLVIEYKNPDNEIVWIAGIPSERYKIEADTIIIYNFDREKDKYRLHIGEDSDIYEFGEGEMTGDVDKQIGEMSYKIKDVKIDNKLAKEITFYNLSKDYKIKDEAEKEKKKIEELLKLEKTKYVGDGEIKLMEKIEVLKNVTVSTYDECSWVREIRLGVKDGKGNYTITRSIELPEGRETEFNMTTDRLEGERIIFDGMVQHCKKEKIIEERLVEEYREIDLEKYTLKKDIPIYEVFYGCVDMDIFPNGSYGCSVWTDINVFGNKIEGATWWNESWGYKKQINITNTAGDLTNYPVRLEINTTNLYEEGKLNTSCYDLRFSNSTEDGLDYWTENCVTNDNSTLSVVWVNVSHIQNGTEIIYMYYGNPTAVSASNGNNTFLLYDNFDGDAIDSNKWTTTGSVTVANGNVTIVGADGEIISNGTYGPNTSLYWYSALKTTSEAGGQTAMCGYDRYPSAYVFIRRYGNDPSNAFQGIAYNTANAQTVNIVAEDNNPHYFEAIRNGTASSIYYVDSTVGVGTTYNPATSEPIKCWARYATETIDMKFLLVRSYHFPEPTYSFESEESVPVSYNLTLSAKNLLPTTPDILDNLRTYCTCYGPGTLTCYTQMYNGSTAYGSVQSATVANNTNTNFYNLSYTYTQVGETWLGEVWCGNGTDNTTKENTTARTILNPNPNIPTINSPTDESTDQEVSISLNVSITSQTGKAMNVSFYNNATKSQIGTTQTEVSSGGTASVTWSGLSYNTSYYWYANSSIAGYENQSAVGTFSTKDSITYNYVTPVQGEQYVDLPPRLRFKVYSYNDGTANITFYNNATGDTICTNNSVSNNSYVNCYWTGLSYETQYYWYANITDTLKTISTQIYLFNTSYNFSNYGGWEQTNITEMTNITAGFVAIPAGDSYDYDFNEPSSVLYDPDDDDMPYKFVYACKAEGASYLYSKLCGAYSLNGKNWTKMGILTNDTYPQDASLTKWNGTYYVTTEMATVDFEVFYNNEFKVGGWTRSGNLKENSASPFIVVKKLENGTYMFILLYEGIPGEDFRLAYNYNLGFNTDSWTEYPNNPYLIPTGWEDESEDYDMVVVEDVYEYPNGSNIWYGTYHSKANVSGEFLPRIGIIRIINLTDPTTCSVTRLNNPIAIINDTHKFAESGFIKYENGTKPHQDVLDGMFFTQYLYTEGFRKVRMMREIPSSTTFSITLNSPENQTTTNDNTTNFNFNVSGTEIGYNCSVYLNSTNYGNNDSVLNNTATTITSSEIPDGDYNWWINCTSNSVENQSEIREITIDTTPPTISITSPTETVYTTSYNISLNVYADETINTWWYILNGGANQTFTPNITFIGQYGLNNLIVYANDSAGNTGQAEVNFTINLQPNNPNPSISPASVYTNTSANCSATFSDNDTATGNLTFRWYIDGDSVYNQTRTGVANSSSSWSLLDSGNFSKGEEINCTVEATDGYSNITDSATETVLNSPPYVVLNYPENGSTGIELNPYLNVTYYDADGDNGNVTFYNGTGIAYWDTSYPNSTACDGYWSPTYPCSRTYDLNWGTFGTAVNPELAYLYANYSKPEHSTNLSELTIKYQNTSSNTVTENLTLLQNCWEQGVLQFRAASDNPGYINASCYNGTGWKDIMSVGSIDAYVRIYETQMNWYIDPSLNTSINITNGTTVTYQLQNLTAGETYYWRAIPTDSEGSTPALEEALEFTTGGLDISAYDNSTGLNLTDWYIEITNGTDSTTGTYNNTATFEWTELPSGNINITVDDGSSTKYYFNSTQNITSGGYQSLNFSLIPKGSNSINLTSSEGWNIEAQSETTIDCSAEEGTPTLTKEGVGVSYPYTVTYSAGTYEFICSVSTETENYKPTSVSEELIVTGLQGCINTALGNQSFSYYSVVLTEYNITTLNLTTLVNEGKIKQDISDIYVDNFTTYINTSGGYYAIVNNTGYNNFTIHLGNYFIENSFDSYQLTDIVDFNITEDSYLYSVTFYDEITGVNELPPNSTTSFSIYCDRGASYNLEFNESEFIFATNSEIDEINTFVKYSVEEYYIRSLMPEDTGAITFYLVDLNQSQIAQLLITVVDYTGEFDESILTIRKNIESSQETITERRLDAEYKVIVYLIVDDKYQIYLDNGNEIRSIGYLYVDTTDLTKDITIGEAIDLDLYSKDFSYGIGYINSTNTIYFRVEDTAGQTIQTEFWVYNKSNNEILFYGNSTNSSSVEFNYVIPDTNGTYFCTYHVKHSYFGTDSLGGNWILDLSDALHLDFPFEFPFAGEVENEIGITWQVFILIMIILGVTMIFGASHGAFAGFFSCVLMGIFSTAGWWSINPVLYAIAMTFAIINVIVNRAKK